MNCPICIEKYTKDTIQVLSCGHDICINCVTKINKCPLCNNNIQIITTPISIINMIEDGYVRCANFQCTKICTSDTINDHTKLCKYKPVKCSLCDNLFPECSFEQHAIECSFRLVNCSHCGIETKCKDLDDHYQQCEKYPITCEYCSEEFIRNDINEHLQICDYRMIKCEFCQNDIKYIELDDHKINYCKDKKL